MNLIDVVWESLVYFGIAAVIVIIISYISFKVRRKVTGEKFAFEKEIEKKEKERAKQKAKEEQKKKLEKQKAEKNKRKKIHTHASDKVRVKPKLKPRPKSAPSTVPSHNKVRFSQKDRIEILNPTEKITTQSSRKTAEKTNVKESGKEKEKKLHSLNTNVIEKYGEDEDEFYTIKIKKDKNK